MALGAIAGVLAPYVVHADPFSARSVIVDQETSAIEGTVNAAPAVVAPMAEKTVSAPSQPASAREYAVKGGDYLCDIARRLLGDPARYQEIVRLNVDRYPSLAKNPNLILVGWQLRLPGPAVAANPAKTPFAPSETSAVSTKPAAMPATDGTPLIGPGQRVLHIGDSHTVGIYGSTIDGAMRETGAQVRTYGVAGSSPSWWYQGTVTKCGYYGRDEKGKVDSPADWRTPRATPSLPDLIKEYKPTVLVVSLGANLFSASEAAVKRETQRIIDTAKAAGCTLVWVGPPRARESVTSIAAQDSLCETIKATVGTQGTFVDSRPVTKYPSSGGDGLHYWGTEGSETAKAWAGSVLQTIQTSGKK